MIGRERRDNTYDDNYKNEFKFTVALPERIIAFLFFIF